MEEEKSLENERLKRLKAEQDKTLRALDKWKLEKHKIVESDKTKLLKHYIKVLLSQNVHSLIVKSKAGMGKSFTTVNIVKDLNIKFSYKNGYSTPLSFYHFLYKHRTELLILDDLDDSIFRNKKMMALLKAALWDVDGKRFVGYDSTSDKLDDVPEVMEFKGKIIILTNEMDTHNNENFKALLSRALNFDMDYNYKEIMKIIKKVVASKTLTDAQRERVFMIIDKHVTPVSQFNLRHLEQLVSLVKYSPLMSEQLFLATFKQDREFALVFELFKSSFPVEQQIKIYSTEFGKSRRQFFMSS